MTGDITHVAGTLLALAGFGIVMGLQASVYGATLDLLARGKRIWTALCFLVGGLATGVTLMLVILLVFNPQSYITALGREADHIAMTRWVDLVAGTAFLVTAAGVAVWKTLQPTLPPKKKKKSGTSTSTVGVYFGIGLAAPVIDLTMWPIMYVVSRTVTSVSEHQVLRLLGVVVFLCVLVAPFFLLAWAWSKFPAQTQKVTATYTRILSYDHRWWAACVIAVIGVAVIAQALIRGH